MPELEPNPSFSLHHDAWGRLVLVDREGKSHVGVEPVRSFPLTAPRQGIAICDVDGRELEWIVDLDCVPEAIRDVLTKDLALREFMPVVQRIVSVSDKGAQAEWVVETDRGRVLLVNGEAGLHRLAGGGAFDYRRPRHSLFDCGHWFARCGQPADIGEAFVMRTRIGIGIFAKSQRQWSVQERFQVQPDSLAAVWH